MWRAHANGDRALIREGLGMVIIGALLVAALVLTASTVVLACCLISGRISDRESLSRPIPVRSEAEREIA